MSFAPVQPVSHIVQSSRMLKKFDSEAAAKEQGAAIQFSSLLDGDVSRAVVGHPRLMG